MKSKPVLLLTFSAIFIAEGLFFFKYYEIGMYMHILTLIALSLTACRIKDIDTSNLMQVLALLPLFRILNNTMPIIFTQTLYVFPLIYGPIFISLYYLAKHQKFSKQELGLSFRKIYLYMPLSIIFGLIFGKIESSIINVESMIPVPDIQNMIIFSMIMLIFTGLAEELLFRSMVQTRLQQVIGSKGGLVIASLLFGAMHSGYGTIYEMIFTASVGFFLGYLFQKTRSLIFIATTHGMINIFLFGLLPQGLI